MNAKKAVAQRIMELCKSRNGPAHGYPRIYKYIRFALRNEAAIA